MIPKFATIQFIQDVSEISLKFNMLKKAPPNILDWYIKKFNPYKIEKIDILNSGGYLIKIPLTVEQAKEDEDKVNFLVSRMLNDIKELDVEIVYPPINFPFEFPNNIRIADGKYVFALLIVRAMEKALNIVKKDFKTSEVLIITDGNDITKILLENIYPHVNYLSLIVSDNLSEDEFSKYNQIATYIFEDVGLNVRITKKNKDALENADIIINVSSENTNYDYYFKRGAVYFDLSSNKCKTQNLIIKREDVLIVTGLRIKSPDSSSFENIYKDELFETYLYVKDRDYRSLVNRPSVNIDSLRRLNDKLNKEDITVLSFYQRDRLLTNLNFMRFLIKSGK